MHPVSQSVVHRTVRLSFSPMNDVHLVLIIPLGRRWKSYSFSSTTTVWPALFPPCGVTETLDSRPHARWKQHQQLKGSRSKFTLVFPSEGRPGNMTPASRRPALYSDTLCPKQNTRRLYATGFYGQRCALLTCPVTPGMWPEFSEGQGGILGLTFREIQTLTQHELSEYCVYIMS